MYRLFYDELTGQFFVGNDAEVEGKLNVLREKLMHHFKASITMNDYCRALGIPEEDPFDTCKISFINCDTDYLFKMDYSMVYGVPAMRISFAG